MTRFMLSLTDAVDTVMHAFKDMAGSEIFVKIPSVKIYELAKSVAPKCKFKGIGIRPGEKMHEQLISKDKHSILMSMTIFSRFYPHLIIGTRERGGLERDKRFQKTFFILAIIMING